jgi:hypothetical protein
MFGCGSSTNNDQGVVFTHLGYYQDFAEDCGDIPTGMTGAIVPLSSPFEGFGSFHEVLSVLGFSNSLAGQTLRVQRVFFDYEIPGATKQPPSTSWVLSSTLGPAGGDDDEEGGSTIDSSLPEHFGSQCNQVYAQVPIVTTQVMEWINLNRHSLPEAPFTMIVSSYATGLTSAGDRYDTNVEQIILDFTPDNIIPPTDGSGGLNSEESSEETAVAS